MLLEFDGHQQKSPSVAGFRGFATSRWLGWKSSVCTCMQNVNYCSWFSYHVWLEVGLHSRDKWMQRGRGGEHRNSHTVSAAPAWCVLPQKRLWAEELGFPGAMPRAQRYLPGLRNSASAATHARVRPSTCMFSLPCPARGASVESLLSCTVFGLWMETYDSSEFVFVCLCFVLFWLFLCLKLTKQLLKSEQTAAEYLASRSLFRHWSGSKEFLLKMVALKKKVTFYRFKALCNFHYITQPLWIWLGCCSSLSGRQKTFQFCHFEAGKTVSPSSCVMSNVLYMCLLF